MGLEELVRERREDILRAAAARRACNVRLFGSVARGEATAESDVDFLVDLNPGAGLLELGGLLMDLQDLLGRRVDVMTVEGLRPRVRERALAEAVPLSERMRSGCATCSRHLTTCSATLRSGRAASTRTS